MIDLFSAPNTMCRTAGFEPLPGYRLIQPLGRGGFGEVWKCEAPGGLFKAVKFVRGGGDGFHQEMRAFEQIKSIRHPFLLTLERVEVVQNDLVMVMELADGQLSDRHQECQAAGRAGIPRPELLGYMLEAAEALDMMGSKYGLQHLDVKPANIFLVSGHAKVGDYGLVQPADLTGDQTTAGGFTPKYTSPEVLLGKVDIRSDQYSLALVYAELLTGRFPYPGQNTNQLMLQHMKAVPDLSGLIPSDRAAIGRALAKEPKDRFRSCLAFVSDLIGSVQTTSTPPPLPSPAIAPRPPVALDVTVNLGPTTTRAHNTPGVSQTTFPPRIAERPTTLLVRPQDRPPPPSPTPTSGRPATVPSDPFADLTPVMMVERLHTPPPRVWLGDPLIPVATVTQAILRQAGQSSPSVTVPKADIEQVRILTTIPLNMMPHKLAVVAEKWGLTVRRGDGGRTILRKEYRDPAARAGLQTYSRSGFELFVDLPQPPAVEVTVATKFFGSPDQTFIRSARSLFPAILDQLRSLLQSVQQRRQHQRLRFDTPMKVFPLFTDGQIGRSVDGRLIDISLGGVQFALPLDPGSNRLFVQFPIVPTIRELAVYVRVLRSRPSHNHTGIISAGRFRVEG